MKIEELKVKSYIISALKELNFKELSPIQEKAIPKLLTGKNYVLKAPTGTGKTHTFLIPVLEKLNPKEDATQVVIVSPTRELARQIFDVASQLVSHSNDEIRIRLAVGGNDRQRDLTKIEAHTPHIVIGTPGRLHDLVVKENVLKIHNGTTFIVDECDMVFDTGFISEVDLLAGKMPNQAQFVLLSATISEEIIKFSKKYLSGSEVIEATKDKHGLNDKITHLLMNVTGNKRVETLDNLVDVLNPYLALIFCSTKEEANLVGNHLRRRKVPLALLHGGISARERKNIMKGIRNEDFVFVVATDLAARGIDIKGVSHIINYSLPKDSAFYIHRTGRTGRMGHEGSAISFYDREKPEYFDKLEKKGISFSFAKIKDGEVVITEKQLNMRSKKKFFESEAVKEVKKKVSKSKKVKPNYKKKYKDAVKKEINKSKKLEKRAQIRAQRKKMRDNGGK